MWFLALAALAISAAGTVYNVISGEQNKAEARSDADKIKSDLDTLLGTEQGKLTTEFTTQKSRLQDYETEVLGSQRQGFAVRGDVGGIDTAAAQVLNATENKAEEDQNLLQKSYQAGMDTLAQQTQLAKDQLDANLSKYLSETTASEISGITSFVSGSLMTLAGLKLPASEASSTPTLMDEPAGYNYNYGAMFGGAGWDPSVGIPRLN
jgi:hypothetical protein